MNFGMLHLAQPDKAIAEAHRVLSRADATASPSGRIPISPSGFGLVLRAIEKFGSTSVPLPEGPSFFPVQRCG
jgi:hypothetical protein